MKKKPTYEELEKRVQELEQTKYDHELMDEKLRESEERFRTVIEQSPSAIEIYEPNGKLLIVNDAWESFWDMKKSDMVNFNIFNDPECERTGLTSAFKKVLQDIECSIPPSKYDPKESGFPGGAIRWINSKMYPIKNQHGKIKNIVLVLEDITAQKDAEEVLQKSHNEIVLKIKERIAERVKAVDSLKVQKKFSEKIVETSNAIIVGLNENHKIVLFNQGAEKITGFLSKEVIGKDWFKIFFKPDIYDEMDRVWESAWGAKYNSYVNPIQTKNGDEKIISWQTTGMYDHADETKHMMLSIGEDITERIQAEEALRESEKQLNTLLNATPGIAFLAESNGTYLSVNNALVKSLNTDKEGLINNSMFDFMSRKNAEKRRLILQKIIKSKKPFQWKDNCAGRYFDNFVYPIFDGKGNVKQIAVFAWDITLRMKAAETLRQYEHIISATNDHMSFLDRNYTYLAVNDAYLMAHKKERSQIIGHTVADTLGDDIFEQFAKEKLDCCLSGEEIHYQAWFDFSGRDQRYMDVAYYPYTGSDGIISGVVVSSHDITEYKLAEENFRNIFEYAPIGLFTIDTNGNPKNINKSVLKILGSSSIEQTKKINVLEFENLQKAGFSKDYKRCLTTRKTVRGESLYTSYWNKQLFIRYMFTPIFDKKNAIKEIQCLIEDFTDRKHIEKALLKSEKQYRILTEHIKDVVWIIDFESMCFLYVSPSAEKLRGYTPEEIIAQPLTQAFTPEAGSHLMKLMRSRAKAFQTGKITSDKYYIDAVELPCKDGSTVWTEIIHSYYINPENNKVEIRGVTRDITERKQAEQELKYSKLQLEAVLNNIDAIVYITDMESYEILFMNHQMKKVLGADLIGKICWKSFHENQEGPCEFCTNDKLIDGNGNPKEPYVWEIFNQKAKRWYELHDQAIPWTDGRLVRMEIALDITERKLSEIAVQRREQYLEALNSVSQLLLIPTDSPPLQEIVDLIGPVSQASRAYIFINQHSSDGNMLASQRAEWCAKGVTPEINNPDLQNMSYDALIPHLRETLQQGDFYKGRVADFPDKERKILESQGILSILIIPMILDNEFIGFIGFDNCVSEYEWDSVDQTFLGTAAVGVAHAIKRTHTENTIRNSLDEKVVLLREIHHRVKNNMQVIISLLRMHGRRINDANLSKVFEDCRDRINAMSLIHESLYQSDDLAKIDFKVYLKKLCRNLGQAYGASGKGIALTMGECDVALDMDQGIAIGMVIAELISNAFKHAFPLGKGGNVSISLSELDTENVKLIIKDDGKGMPPEIDIMNSPSLGLRLAVSAVTLELGGSIELERDKGTQFMICFKYKRK